jgi:hypothetical protein
MALVKPPGNLCTVHFRGDYRKTACSSHVASEKELITTAREFKEMCEKLKTYLQEVR